MRTDGFNARGRRVLPAQVGLRLLWGLCGLSAGAQAQPVDLQVQSWAGGNASLIRGDYPDWDNASFGSTVSHRLSDGTLVPGAVLEASTNEPFHVSLPSLPCDHGICHPAEFIRGSGSGHTLARADFGSLGVAASASIGGSTTVSLWPTGSSQVAFQARAAASYTEVISFAAALLPLGSPVSFTVGSVVHATLPNPPTGEPNFELLSELDVTYSPSVLRPATGAQFELTPFVWSAQGAGGDRAYGGVQASFDVQLGDVVTLQVKMVGSAGVGIREDAPPWPDHTSVSFSNSTSVSAMNSLTTSIVVNTPGVSLTAASGHVYAPVPEPGTWALFASGLLAIACRRRAIRV